MTTSDEENKPLDDMAKLSQRITEEYGLPADIAVDKYRLVCTSVACPEQYDVFDADGQQVGYLRLRHGMFRADYPTHGGETVYESNPQGDGVFEAAERLPELIKAVQALDLRHKKGLDG